MQQFIVNSAPNSESDRRGAKKAPKKSTQVVRPPGPKGKLILGSLPERRSQPLQLYLNGALTYGDVVYYRMGYLNIYLLNNPDHIKYVLQDNQKNYFKGVGYEKLLPVLGHGLLMSDGDFWHRQRRLSQPAFHRQRIVEFSKVMSQSTAAMLERWSRLDSPNSPNSPNSNSPLDIAQEMMRLTLAIVSRTLLSTDVSDEADNVGQALSRLLSATNKRVLSLLPWEKLPLPSNAQFNRDLKVLDRVVGSIIEERRKTNHDAGDLLSMLMNARDEDTGESMNDKQLRDEVMTIFLAGHETTANLLAWTWYLLSTHPEIARKLRAEVLEVLGPEKVPSFEDLPRLKYTLMILEESLRLYPPAWVLARENKEQDQIGGYTIPKGSVIVICPYVVHRLPHLWENPEGFDPERFNPDVKNDRHKYSYFPFSGGPRQCIGTSFALTEAQIILAMVAQKYRLDLVSGHPVEPEPLITLRPKNGVKMNLHRYP